MKEWVRKHVAASISVILLVIGIIMLAIAGCSGNWFSGNGFLFIAMGTCFVIGGPMAASASWN